MKKILIIGGGAAGMSAAISAAKADPSARITILEGLDRVGKKILATGNGRCNLTNQNISPAHYHSGSPRQLKILLAGMPVSKTLDFFHDLGLYCTTEDMGRVYPYSRQAATVLDTLLLALDRSRIHVACGCKVTDIRRNKDGFAVTSKDGQRFQADRVILTAGGMAAPKQGSDGSGLSLAQSLGHHCAPTYPCLTAFRCDAPILKGLKGIRAEGKMTLLVNGKETAAEQGEIQFTDYGLSGIPAFQLSCHLKPGWKKAELAVDLLPALRKEEIVSYIHDRAKQTPQEPLERFMPGLIHRKLLYAALKSAGISPLSRNASSLTPREMQQLAEILTDWRFPVAGTLGWDQAQVTGGGILLQEIDGSFASQCCPGLYLAGEVLDVVGDCGGFNLHWAWCSGMIAGTAAVQ